MSHPLVIVTTSSVTTCIRWWANCRVDGTSVVLTDSREDDRLVDLVVAEFRSAAEAKAFLRTLNERLLCMAHVFDAREWPGLARDQATDNSAGDG